MLVAALQVCVIVDESGTEAAAVTSVMMLFGCAMPSKPPPPVVIRFDRPFLFMLVDDAASTVLFVGTVAKPKNRAFETSFRSMDSCPSEACIMA